MVQHRKCSVDVKEEEQDDGMCMYELYGRQDCRPVAQNTNKMFNRVFVASI
jgi:hypothetical protein